MANACRRVTPEEIELIEKFRKSRGQPEEDPNPTGVLETIAAAAEAAELPLSGVKRFAFLSDTHGDVQDDAAVEAALGFVDRFKPHYRIAGGDHFDCRAIRSGAKAEEKRDSIRRDKEKGREFLKRYVPTHLLWGNHDVRLWDVAKHRNGPISDYCHEIIEQIEEDLAGYKTVTYKYDKRHVLRLNDRTFCHGFGAGGPIAARQHAAAYGNVMFGHGHANDTASVPFAGDFAEGMMVGCLCTLEHDFQRAALNTLRHGHGFGFGYLLPDGASVAYQARVVRGKVIVPGI